MYTAFALLEKGVNPEELTIVAEYLPGDQSTYYTSPWAGGNFSCISPDDVDTLFYDKYTYTSLKRIQEKLGGARCGLDYAPSTEYWDEEPSEKKLDSLRTYLNDFKIISKDRLPTGVIFGIQYTTWNFNSPFFLECMFRHFKGKGVTFSRRKLDHIDDAYLSSSTKVVFNCSGIGAHKLGGVTDTTVYPVRGQVIAIKAPHFYENRMRWGRDSATYIIPRPNSNGTLILGGFVQKDNWSGDTFGYETEDILKRTLALAPEISEKGFEITRVVAGLRPYRKDGARIEKEERQGRVLIHNYGAGGYGYQAGYGMAERATNLLFGNNSKL